MEKKENNNKKEPIKIEFSTAALMVIAFALGCVITLLIFYFKGLH